LFWALRGAGAGHFGVVTSLELRLHRMPARVRCGIAYYPIEVAARMVPAILTYMNESAPRELGIFGSLRYREGRPVFMLFYLYCARRRNRLS
jgi:FAD/FMN-containing dehydrogenase